MEYEIVATLGPAGKEETTWREMLSAGATAFRLNTSHLSLEELSDWVGRLEPFISGHPDGIPVVLDLQGSKWRLGQFSAFQLQAGQRVELLLADSAALPGVLPVPHPDFFRAVSMSDGRLALNDDRVRLQVRSGSSDLLTATVTRPGEISSRKGITFAESRFRKEELNDKDREIARRTAHLRWVRYAISYVRDAAEMERYRVLLGDAAHLIAKLERKPALETAVDIARTANALWLCRGDLGAEMGLRGMAEAIHDFSAGRLPTIAVPVLLAGQVLEHMTLEPTPTRSEVTCMYESLLAGYRGFVLSDEAAIGKYPVESCRTAAMFR